METYKYQIIARDMGNAGVISSTIKKMLRERGVDRNIIRRVAIASYEAEINVAIHSVGGYCDVKIDDDTLTMNFIDYGPGIPSIENAMKKGWSTASKTAHELGFGAGMGFPNIKEASDRLDIQTSPDGTNVEIFFNLR